MEVDPLKPAVIGGAGAWRTMMGKAKPPSTPQTDTSINCKYAHAVPKADGSEHAREVPRPLEVTALVDAAHKAGQSLVPKPQSAGRTGAHLLLARLSALAPIAAQRGNTTNSNQQIISLNALARAHYRRSIGTRGGAQASAAD
ncbi:hypothetical protein T492DRAFT_871943 [Pavlovales sp. CCMP2436]|nr:hypothetical protein T492DRAFT_871943 [Pavlovales sp. CCMP2436]